MPRAKNMNALYYGDNLAVLRRADFKDDSVDLCYIDPPFNSKRTYNQIYNNVGREDVAQAQAFVDTWTWNPLVESHYDEIVGNAGGRFNERTIELIKGLKGVLKTSNSLLAYLIEMTVRIVELHRVLKPTGSFYLHCDPAGSHYLKLICDSIFLTNGGEYQNEIVWRRTGAHGKTLRFGPIHDTIFFYTKSNKWTWTNPKKPYMRGHVNQYFVKDEKGWRTNYYGNVLTGSGIRGGESGKVWEGFDPTAKGRHWAIPGKLLEEVDENLNDLSQHQKLSFLLERGFIRIEPGQAWPMYEHYVSPKDGQSIPDIWAYQPYTEGTVFGTEDGIDVDVRWPQPNELLGYQTQKPEGLMRRIIQASSNEGDLVLDAFCGCGTTIAAAEQLKRRWIGIDITYQAIAVILRRLEKRYPDTFSKIFANIYLDGIPKDVESAIALANRRDDRVRKEFEKWAVLTYTNNRAVINEKKGADKGIDGIAYFVSSRAKDTSKAVIQVKSGGVSRSDIATLNSDRQREGAEIGVLITLEEPSKQMYTEAKSSGIYQSELMAAPVGKIRIVTVKAIIEEFERLDLPMSLEVLKAARAVVEGNQLAFLEED